MVYEYTKPRGPVAASFTGPGTKYALPNLVGHPNHDPRSPYLRQPAYSFGQKHFKLTDSSPGPCYNPEDKVYRDGKDGAPKFSLNTRPMVTISEAGPGPGAYQQDANHVGRKPPVYSFGLGYSQRKADQVPGPNVYHPGSTVGKSVQSNRRSAPAYSLYGRSEKGSFNEDLSKTPGPGAYSSTESSKFLNTQPAYTIGSRYQLPSDGTIKPGPGAHSPGYGYSRRSAPTVKFGIRHSEYKAECITANDEF